MKDELLNLFLTTCDFGKVAFLPHFLKWSFFFKPKLSGSAN